jgi:hypothetical protein
VVLLKVRQLRDAASSDAHTSFAYDKKFMQAVSVFVQNAVKPVQFGREFNAVKAEENHAGMRNGMPKNKFAEVEIIGNQYSLLPLCHCKDFTVWASGSVL